MAEAGGVHFQEWGEGDPVIALHPLALESTAFASAAEEIAGLGLRTLAVDLPGFGQTPLIESSLTPAALAEPVIEFARNLEKPPIVMGMSLGGRVALEVALKAPDAVRGVVGIASYLPWREYRQAIGMASYLDPAWAEKIPLEKLWPVLKRTANALESIPALENDWFARACVRVTYYLSCPATRTAFFSAARELALDPAFGEDGLWTRLEGLEVPASFLWAGRDGLIPSSHAEHIAAVLPRAAQIEVACSGHFVNFLHHRCMEKAIAEAVGRILEAEPDGQRRTATAQAPCVSRGWSEGSDRARARRR